MNNTINSNSLQALDLHYNSDVTNRDDRRIVETKGLAALGDEKCAGIKNIVFVAAKVLSCLALVFAPITFLLPPLTFFLINNHYKDIARKTIDADNNKVVQKIANRILKRDANEDEVKELSLTNEKFIDFNAYQTITRAFEDIENAEEKEAEAKKAFNDTNQAIAEDFFLKGVPKKLIKEVFLNSSLTTGNLEEKHQMLMNIYNDLKKQGNLEKREDLTLNS